MAGPRAHLGSVLEGQLAQSQVMSSMQIHVHVNHLLLAEAKHRVFGEPFQMSEDYVQIELLERSRYVRIGNTNRSFRSAGSSFNTRHKSFAPRVLERVLRVDSRSDLAAVESMQVNPIITSFSGNVRANQAQQNADGRLQSDTRPTRILPSLIFTAEVLKYQKWLQERLEEYAGLQQQIISAVLAAIREVNDPDVASQGIPSNMQPDYRRHLGDTIQRNTSKQEEYTKLVIGAIAAVEYDAVADRELEETLRDHIEDFGLSGRPSSSRGLVSGNATMDLTAASLTTSPIARLLNYKVDRRDAAMKTIIKATKSCSSTNRRFDIIFKDGVSLGLCIGEQNVKKFKGPLENILHDQLEFLVMNQQRFSKQLTGSLSPHASVPPSGVLNTTKEFKKR
ncbi:unnamed protein product, partial [Notodromas monacha]